MVIKASFHFNLLFLNFLNRWREGFWRGGGGGGELSDIQQNKQVCIYRRLKVRDITPTEHRGE